MAINYTIPATLATDLEAYYNVNQETNLKHFLESMLMVNINEIVMDADFLNALADDRRKVWIEKILQQNSSVTVDFNKVDGTRRVIRGTLKEGLVPAFDSESNRKDNPTIVTIWDLDAKQWKSFKIMSVNEIRLLDV